MKRFLSIITAGCLALAALSCVKEEDKAIVDLSKATPPVLLSGSVDGEVTVKYTPGVFDMDFNQKMNVYHTLALVSVNEEDANITLSTKNEDNTLTLSAKTLTNALKVRGFKTDDRVPVALVVRASIQDPSRGITNGYVDSENRYAFTWVMPEEIAGSPYEDYTQASTWSLIGSLTAYGISWDGDLNMWTDGNGNHVAAHVTLKAGDEVKFRKDQDWAVNMGGDLGDLDAEFPVAQDGANIKVAADGVYDLFLFENSGTALVAAGFDPYPEYTQESNWSLIGSLTAYGISWDGDIAMVSDGSSHAAFGVVINADDEFKFRQDKDWAVNLGGDFGGIDAEFAVTQDGPNVKAPAGVYDIFVNPGAGTATVAAASGLKVSSKIGAETPGPEPQPVTGWNIIGLNGDWENDIAANHEGDLWTAFITAVPAEGEEMTSFKWRKDGGWDENYGGPGEDDPYVGYELGTAFEAVAGGKNIGLKAGFYKVVLDVANLTITVSAGDVYSLIGEINSTSWNTDFLLTEENGVYVSDAVYIGGGFKIRHNYSWADDDTYGVEEGFTPALDQTFVAAQPGANISVPEPGNYKVKFVPATKEVTISAVGFEVPEIDLSQFEQMPDMAGAEVWALIGPAVTDWSTDYDLQKISDDPEIWAAMNVPFKAADKFKFRGNHEWASYDLGSGSFVLNEPIVLQNGGDIVGAFEGTYNVFLYPTYGMAYIQGEGEAPEPVKPEAWSIIGTINGDSWSTDLDLTNVEGDIWKYSGLTVTESDEFKIRANHDWSTSVGGPEENDQSIIDQSNPYGVFKPVIGTAFAAGSKNIRIGVAGQYDVTFDYAAQTILITVAGSAAPANITIDGDMSDWEAVKGVSNGTHGMFKVASDDENIYFYTWRTTEGRFSELWGTGVGYVYFAFDLDSNPDNGVSLNGNGPYDYIGFIYCFGGTASAPVIEITKAGDCAPSDYTVANVVIKGKVDENGAYLEYSIPRADLPEIPKTPVTVTSWGNKDLAKVQLTATL